MPLLDVYAWTAPEGMHDLYGKPRGERFKIATIELQTELYTSDAGNEILFFQHHSANNDYRAFPREWKRNAGYGTDFPDFNRARIPQDQWGAFPTIKDLTKEDHEAGNWPWPNREIDAEAKYLELINDESTGGCPFSWLF